MVLGGVPEPNAITGRAVRPDTHEQVVHGTHDLAVVEGGLSQSNGSGRTPSCQDLGHERRQVPDAERQQRSVPTMRVRVHADEGLAVEVLEGVGDHAVLAQGNNHVPRPKDEVGHETTFEDLHPPPLGQQPLGFASGEPVRLILALIIGEIGPQMFHIESGLGHRVETRSQFRQAARADDQDDFGFCVRLHS